MRRTPRITEDTCCHNCPDHRPVSFSPDGKAITCRQGCAKWKAHEEAVAQRMQKKDIAVQGNPASRTKEMNLRRMLKKEGGIRK